MDIDRIVSEVWDSRNDVQDSRRYFLNQVTAASDAWVTPQEWDRLARKHVVPSGAQITLGFDGSRTDDHTALVACEVETGHLFVVDIWDPKLFGGEVPTEQVDGTVRRAFANYDVVAFYADYYPWESYVDAWARDFGQGLVLKRGSKNPIVWDMRGNKRETTEAVEAFHATIVDGGLTHDGEVRLTQHVHNARRWPNQYGVTMGKESRESPRKMDGAMAAMLARKAWQDYQASPDSRKRRRKTGRAVFS
jgi:phage terminase large subunit-like protein